MLFLRRVFSLAGSRGAGKREIAVRNLINEFVRVRLSVRMIYLQIGAAFENALFQRFDLVAGQIEQTQFLQLTQLGRREYRIQ